MKKLFFLSVLVASLTFSASCVKAQDLVIPVKRLYTACADSSFFNFQPSTVLLRNIGSGDIVTNFKFYYEITDSIAATAPHEIDGVPFTRSCHIAGNMQLPVMTWLAIIIPTTNTTGYTSEQLLNKILNHIDMYFDNTKPIIYGGKSLN